MSDVYARIDKAGQPLSRICKLGQGMQTGKNSVFGKKTSAQMVSMGATSNLVRKRVRNTDIQRFHLLERDEQMLYLEDASDFDSLPDGVKKYLRSQQSDLKKRAAFKRGNCDWWRYTWPLQKELYVGPRIICPYLAKENRFAIDDNFGFIGLTDTTVIFPAGEKEDLRYICALLNSRLLNLRFKGIGKLKSNGILEYFDNSVSQLPIRRILWTNARDGEIHDRIVSLHNLLTSKYNELTKPIAATVARDVRTAIDEYEVELDQLVCELYGFTVKELNEIETLVTAG